MEKLIQNIISDPKFERGLAWDRRGFCADEVIIREGDEGKSLFYIESGQLRVTVDVAVQERRNVQPGIGDLHKGDLFGDTSLHESGVRTATVIAVTDGCLLEINGEKLGVYLDEHPVMGYAFYKSLFSILFKRLTDGNRRIQYLLAWGLKARGTEKHSLPLKKR